GSSSEEPPSRGHNAFGVEPLVAHLLPQSAGSLLARPDVIVPAAEAPLEKLGAESTAEARPQVERLGDEHEGGVRQQPLGRLIVEVERRLVDESHLDPFLTKSNHRPHPTPHTPP